MIDGLGKTGGALRRAALVLLLAVLAHPAAAEVNRDAVAVIIGNKAYTGDTPEVDYAYNDAEAMKRYVIDVLGYSEINIIDLRDATLGDLRRVFGTRQTEKGQLFNWLKPGRSDVTVFYSGHGVPGLTDKRGYLLPVDGDPSLAEITAYPFDVLQANLEKLPARSVRVFIDACFSGDSAGGMLIRASSAIGISPALPGAASNFVMLTAASGDQVASWDRAAEHGLFTKNLLAALGGKADGAAYGNGDGVVTLAEVKAFLDEEMTLQARRMFNRQQDATMVGGGETVLAALPPPRAEPAYAIEEMDETLRTLRNANVRAAPASDSEKLTTLPRGTEVNVTGKVAGRDWVRVALAGGATGFIWTPLLGKAADEVAAPPQPPAADREVVFWTSIEDSGNAKDFAAYLERFPNGTFSALARNRLEELQRTAAVVVPPPRTAPPAGRHAPGSAFRDCSACPEMVAVPAGDFMMGSPANERGRWHDEGPQHRVSVAAFAIGKYEVTFAEWDACVAGGGCNGYRPEDRGWGRGDRPVINVTWDNAKAYAAWLSRKTGEAYRLPSEAEWEYAARAGTTTRYWWGNRISSSQANYRNPRTVAVGSYAANAFGLYDVVGNVWEWVEDCYRDSYRGAPGDGRVWLVGGDCSRRVLRGGSWVHSPRGARAAVRIGVDPGSRDSFVGFRLARTLKS